MVTRLSLIGCVPMLMLATHCVVKDTGDTAPPADTPPKL